MSISFIAVTVIVSGSSSVWRNGYVRMHSR